MIESVRFAHRLACKKDNPSRFLRDPSRHRRGLRCAPVLRHRADYNCGHRDSLSLGKEKRVMENRAINNVVLVHGGFVDGSGWEGVYRALRKQGYNVSIVQNPTSSLSDDVAVTKRAIA